MNLSVTKKFEVCCAHRLPEHKGKCEQFHGHNYIIEVEVGGTTVIYDPPECVGNWTMPGMITDFEDLKYFVTLKILEVIDHATLNDALPNEFMPPTAENMCRWAWCQLNQDTYSGKIQRIRIWETSTSYAEIRKGDT